MKPGRAEIGADKNADARQQAEDAYITNWRAKTGRSGIAAEATTGLALSGGGIRSAAFCLGVLQAFAKHHILGRFDYLSTVSGGGYSGASLTWFTSRFPFGCSKTDLPFDIDDPNMAPRRPAVSPGGDILRHLRRYGNYLVPGRGIDLASGVGVVLRGIAVNMMVWLPLVTLGAVICFIFEALLKAGYSNALQQARLPEYNGYIPALGIPAMIFLAICILYSFFTWNRPGRRKPADERGIPYGARRGFEIFISKYLRFYAFFVVASSLIWLSQSHFWLKTQWISAASTLIGGAWGLVSRFAPGGEASSKTLITAAPAAAALLLYGLCLGCFLTAWQVFPFVWAWVGTLPHGLAHLPSAPVVGLLTVAILAMALGWFSDINFMSLHRFYRDRLMEAFLPDYPLLATGPETGSPANLANRARLAEMCDETEPKAPYHLINSTLVLTKITETSMQDAGLSRGRAEVLRLRGGDSFLLSPRFCGCDSLGWYKTTEFMNGSLTLATAVAISAAAVNPSAAANGIGPTRSSSFAALMSLLNVRLGFWVANPMRKPKNNALANHFNAGWHNFFDSLTPEAKFLELTDGGHFENLGVYELIRRQVRTIVVCDAGADSDYAFADLQNLLSRAEADFKAVIKFDPPPPLAALMPNRVPGNVYPATVKMSQSPFVVGDIIYAPPPGSAPGATVPQGKIYYLKTTIFKSLRLSVLGYKSANPEFPDDPTTDQFFTQAQFEAYRELGFASVEQMLAVPDIAGALSSM